MGKRFAGRRNPRKRSKKLKKVVAHHRTTSSWGSHAGLIGSANVEIFEVSDDGRSTAGRYDELQAAMRRRGGGVYVLFSFSFVLLRVRRGKKGPSKKGVPPPCVRCTRSMDEMRACSLPCPQ